MRNKAKTEKILGIMNVLAWVVFIGLIIEAGAILMSYTVSIFNPIAAKDLHKKMSLYELRESNFLYYTIMVLLTIALLILKAYTAWLLVKVLTKIKLSDPFTMDIAKTLEKISYFIVAIWGLNVVHDAFTDWLAEGIAGLKDNLVLNERIFLAGIVFVIAQIFRKGVEIQSENELTI